jgi:hypothetical protein
MPYPKDLEIQQRALLHILSFEIVINIMKMTLHYHLYCYFSSPGHSATHFTICATSLSMTVWAPGLTHPFFSLKSEQWKAPGMICTGACGVDSSGPSGRNSDETPDVRQGSNSPFVQMRRVVSSSLQPLVCLFTWCSLLSGLSALAYV